MRHHHCSYLRQTEKFPENRGFRGWAPIARMKDEDLISHQRNPRHPRFTFATLSCLTKLPLWLLVASIPFLLGCGTAAYEQKFEQSLKEYRLETGFSDLWKQPVADLPGSELQIRLPRFFDQNANALDAESPEPHERTEPLEHDYRLQPWFLDLPGYKRTYEVFHKDSTPHPKPIYCYLAVYDQPKPSAEKLRESLRAQLVKRFPDTTSPWETRELRTPAGTKETWHYLSASGDQRFHIYGKEGKVDYKVTDGTYHLFFRTIDGRQVMVGWRITRELEDEVDLARLATASVGTVRLGE